MNATARRRQPEQIVLRVEETRWLNPHLVRVIAGGEGMDAFADNGKTDKYVKIYFVKPELGLTPPYDVLELRERLPAEDWPLVRTYTVRWIDPPAQRLAIDFVVHGDTGVAGPWAAAAKPGEPLVIAGPGGAYVPDPDAPWYMFAGDSSALPAIGAALEALPDRAVGVALLEVLSQDDIVELLVPPAVEVKWLINPAPETDDGTLARAFDAYPWPSETPQVFAHGERESMKAVRAVLRDREVPRAQISLSGYWARGRNEDTFQTEKREPIGKIPD